MNTKWPCFLFIDNSLELEKLHQNLINFSSKIVTGDRLFAKIKLSIFKKRLIIGYLILHEVIIKIDNSQSDLFSSYKVGNVLSIKHFIEKDIRIFTMLNSFLSESVIKDSYSENEINLVLTKGSSSLNEYYMINELDTISVIINIILVAERSLWFFTAFGDIKGLKTLLPLIKRKFEEGIDVFFLVRKESIKNFRLIFDFLPKSRIKVYKDNSRIISFLHSKVVLADEKVSYLGSANLTKRSLYDNLEIGVKIDSHQFNSKLSSLLKFLWENQV